MMYHVVAYICTSIVLSLSQEIENVGVGGLSAMASLTVRRAKKRRGKKKNTKGMKEVCVWGGGGEILK